MHQSKQLTIEQAISQAKKYFKQNKKQQAFELYQSVLKKLPSHPIAKKWVKKLTKELPISQNHSHQPSQNEFKKLKELFQSGQMDKVEIQCKGLLSNYPESLLINNILALSVLEQGRLEEAVVLFNQVLKIDANFLDASSNLGNILSTLGKNKESLRYYNKAIELKPDSINYSNRASVLNKLKNYKQAKLDCKKAIQLNPHFMDTYNNLGNAYQGLKDYKKALEHYTKAIELSPYDSKLYCNSGIARINLGKYKDALIYCKKSIELSPTNSEAYLNQANALLELKQYQEAANSYDKAIQIKPEFAEAYHGKGNIYIDDGLIDLAITHYKKAITLKPELVDAYSGLGGAQIKKGEISKGLLNYKKAIKIESDFYPVYNNLCFQLNYLPGLSIKEVYQAHQEFAQQFDNKLADNSKQRLLQRKKNKHLKIGYISADFRTHSVAYFFKPLIENHNQQGVEQRVEIYCYSNSFKQDEMTQTIKNHSSHWREITALNDQQVVDLIIKDNIDILVDLSGHTAGNRLLVFTYKPAPVQITWLGYPNTTGLKTMDYRFTDIIADPIDKDNKNAPSDAFYSEKLIRLDNGFLCYSGDESVLVKNRDNKKNHLFTFGSFNNLSKVNDNVIELWSKILKSVPNSVLLLKEKLFSDENTRIRYLEMFKRQGIDASRLELVARLEDKNKHLDLYHKIDICLDTFPYNGTTTTFEALWMGVPVISLCGESHASRVGASILSHLNLKQYIATSEDEYLQIAMDLADNKKELQSLHQGLRKRLKESPLMDAKRFAKKLEHTYHQLADNWYLNNGIS